MPEELNPANQYDVEIEKARLKWSFWRRIGDGIVNALTVGSMALPIWLLGNNLVEPLAGKTTDANIDVSIRVSLTLAASIAVNIVQHMKGRQRRRTVVEQRAILDQYEEDLGLPPPAERQQLGRRTL